MSSEQPNKSTGENIFEPLKQFVFYFSYKSNVKIKFHHFVDLYLDKYVQQRETFPETFSAITDQ